MRFEKSKQLYSYWLKLKGERAAPERSEIEPSDIRDLLGDTFILEINHAAKYVIYRLAGTRLCSAYGKELKGIGYFVHWHEQDNIDIMHTINKVHANFQPCVISHFAQTQQERFLAYETLLLPLQPINDGTSRILGLCSAAKAPFWLGAEPVIINKLRSIREIGQSGSENEITTPILTPPPIQHDGSQPESTKSDSKNRKFGHLTLLDGGKS
ncbi:MAG: PAS domain-containing protein [Rhizobiaceae bacterium]|nr:PAS domain-containing protein [Rhizobiaceae bacterium]